MALKRPLRWLLYLFAALVLLVGAGLAYVLNSGVQTSYALKALRQTDPQAKLDKVALGLSGGEISGLELTTGGYKVNLGQAQLQYSLSNLLFGNIKVIDRVTLTGLVVDASHPAPAAATPATAKKADSGPPNATLAALLIKQADFSGTVLLPNQRTIAANLTARDLGAGSTGHAEGQLGFKDSSANATVKDMSVQAKLDLTCDAKFVPQKIAFDAEFAATLAQQAQPTRLQASLNVAAPAGSAARKFTLTVGQPGAAASLLALDGNYADNGSLAGDFSLNCTRAQIEPFAFGAKLPDFSAHGAGQFASDPAAGSASLKGNLNAKASGLEVFQPQLRALGAVQVNADLDVAWASDALAAKQIHLTLAPDNGQAVATLDLLKPMTVAVKKHDGGASDFEITQGSGPGLAQLTLQQFPLAWVTPFLPANISVTGNSLSGQANLGTGNNGAILLQTNTPLNIGNLSVTQDNKPLLAGATLVVDASANYQAGDTVAVVRQILLATGNTTFAQFSANVTLHNATTAADKTASLSVTSGHLAVALDQLRLQPLAKEWGDSVPATPLLLDATFALQKAAGETGAYTVPAAEMRVAAPNAPGPAYAEVKLLQALTVPSASNTTTAAKAAGNTTPWPVFSGNLVSAKLNQLPLALLSALTGNLQVRGNTVSADVVVRGEGADAHGEGIYSVTSNAPFSVDRLVLRQGTEPMLNGVDITGLPSARISHEGLSEFSMTGLLCTMTTGNLVAGSVQYSHPPVATGAPATLPSVKFNFNGDLHRLMSQPAVRNALADAFKRPELRDNDNLGSGNATLSGQLSPDGAFSFNADLTDWHVTYPSRKVKSIKLANASGKYAPDGSNLQITVPITAEGVDGPTNCTLKFSLTGTDKTRAFDLSLLGDSLVVDDVLALNDAFRPIPPPAAPGAAPAAAAAAPANATAAAAPSTKPDAAPFWGDFPGTAKINLKHLFYSTYQADNLNAQAQAAATKVSLDNVSAQLMGAPLTFNGNLSFEKSNAKEPYDLAAKLDVKNFDSTRYFKARDPKGTPPVDGKFTMAASASGRGANLDDLLARVQFDSKLNSSSGTLHLLDRMDKNSLAGGGLNVASTVAGIASIITGPKAPKGLTQFNDLVALLQQVKYTDLTMAARRGPNLNIELTQLVVKNPEINLTGSGRITYRPGVPIPAQPLVVNLQLDGKGKVATLLGGVGLMRAPANASAYGAGPKFAVTGTLQQPNTDNLYSLLKQAAVGNLLGK